MTIEEVMEVLEMQEEILQFSHFTNADAWNLGNMLVAEAQRRGAFPMISIRLNNGFIVFQYGFDGTNLCNENWISRKQRTVMVTEKSSLHLAMALRQSGETLEDMFLDPKEYAASGGGFPIRIEEVGVIGSILVSGMDPVSDHDLIIKAVSRYLHVDEVPRIRAV
ncbi:MAG: heme-degrading domain-containing protein [Ruminococcus sp.]|jgi:uncharacterized protein (UPF0303 family)